MFLEILKNDKKSESQWYHNTGTIIWYIIFLAIIPLMIRHKYSFDGLRYYFPMVDLIANVFATSGIRSKHIFKDLLNICMVFINCYAIDILICIKYSLNPSKSFASIRAFLNKALPIPTPKAPSSK